MRKSLIIAIMLPILALALVACTQKKPLEIWVGIESQAFYQEKANEYKEIYKEKTGKDFPVNISVKAVDTGTAGGVFLNDPTTAGDIITVAHDNLGRLIAGSSAIAPIQSESLINQINNDNHEVYVNAIKGKVQGEEYYFGVPYIGQALILYYNKQYISAEQVQSWEGILEAAKAANKQALSITGTDGFNNSFLLLAVDEETKTSSLQLYDDASFENNYATGADVLSFLKYGQMLFTTPNGAKRPTDSGWQVELQQGVSLSVVGGAWHFNSAKAALGANLGIAILPSFTLTEETVYDVANNSELVGKTFRSGTFADVKMFVKNKVSKYSEYLDDILAYFSSKEVQEESFVVANNLPAYKNATAEFDSLKPENATTPDGKLALELASAQLDMFQYGRPQPFGHHVNFNFYYYSKNAPEKIMDLLDNARGQENFQTDAKILEVMKKVENIWKTGKEE
ncbi:sugar ABC transporter substrate-binding protein [Acholeplasma hippikon]|uniref:Maltose-binding periplasmic proteins/domains n=1 Tax=Acholeplasma hippikon TaxID=264636 RepID=A0A449BJ50_9MOLU|nr:extracellular solute-binding protein [Acholeplasma hippikon]VEU82347.1 Maltose-binding periplasmic proteins/domains [Acholeplasma hippikon]